MALLLFIAFISAEVLLAVLSLTSYREKREWLRIRWIIRAGELVLFLVVMLFPNVSFDFKCKLTFAVLVFRLLRVLLMWAVKRKSIRGNRSKAGAVFAALGSIIGLALALIPAFLFREYEGLPTSGKYEIASTETILIDRSRVEAFEIDGSFREIHTHFFYPADAEDGETFPLVLFPTVRLDITRAICPCTRSW